MITIKPMTPEELDAMMEAVRIDEAVYALQPEAFEPLQRYVKSGIMPGHFLTAVLENDLQEAMGRADLFNRRRVFEYTSWLFNNAPMACWGSPEKVSAWIKRHAADRGRE